MEKHMMNTVRGGSEIIFKTCSIVSCLLYVLNANNTKAHDEYDPTHKQPVISLDNGA